MWPDWAVLKAFGDKFSYGNIPKTFLGYFENINFQVKTAVATTFWATFWTIWATFYFSIWSHWIRTLTKDIIDNSFKGLRQVDNERSKVFGPTDKQTEIPWSSGYGWRLMFKRLCVQIPALYTGWTFFHIDLL